MCVYKVVFCFVLYSHKFIIFGVGFFLHNLLIKCLLGQITMLAVTRKSFHIALMISELKYICQISLA